MVGPDLPDVDADGGGVVPEPELLLEACSVVLADAVQVHGGKLSLLGGAWTRRPSSPVPMSLAVILRPLVAASFEVSVSLLDEDGALLAVAGSPVQVVSVVNVEFGPGHCEGSPDSVPLAFSFGSFPMCPGRYEWRVVVENDRGVGGRVGVWRCPFVVSDDA